MLYKKNQNYPDIPFFNYRFGKSLVYLLNMLDTNAYLILFKINKKYIHPFSSKESQQTSFLLDIHSP